MAGWLLLLHGRPYNSSNMTDLTVHVPSWGAHDCVYEETDLLQLADRLRAFGLSVLTKFFCEHPTRRDLTKTSQAE